MCPSAFRQCEPTGSSSGCDPPGNRTKIKSSLHRRKLPQERKQKHPRVIKWQECSNVIITSPPSSQLPSSLHFDMHTWDHLFSASRGECTQRALWSPEVFTHDIFFISARFSVSQVSYEVNLDTPFNDIHQHTSIWKFKTEPVTETIEVFKGSGVRKLHFMGC